MLCDSKSALIRLIASLSPEITIFSELQHNWSLRIDRIPSDSLITPIPRGKWRNQLDSVSAEFQLFDGLARSYRTKTAIDIANELISNDPLVRQITRQVTSSFWFFREILPYGEDCLLALIMVGNMMARVAVCACPNYHSMHQSPKTIALTPYIFDDRCDFRDFGNAIKEWYDTPSDENRWVIMANLIPWEKFEEEYAKSFCENKGACSLQR